MRTNAYDFQIGIQSGLGSPATVPTHYLKCIAGSGISPNTTITADQTGEGKRAADGISYVSAMAAGGTLNVVAQPDNLGELLYLGHGAAGATGATAPYTHTLTIAQTSALPYFTVFKHVDTLYEIYPDCKLEDLSLDVATANRLLIAKCQIVSVGTPIYKTSGPTGATQEASTLRFSWDQAKGTWVVDGATIGYISVFGYHVKNNLQTVPGEGLTGYALQEGPCDAEITAALEVLDMTLYNKKVYGSTNPSDAATVQAIVPTGAFAAKFTAVAASPGPEVSYSIAATALEYRSAPPKIVGDPTGKVQVLTMVGRCVGTDPKVSHVVKNARATVYGA